MGDIRAESLGARKAHARAHRHGAQPTALPPASPRTDRAWRSCVAVSGRVARAGAIGLELAGCAHPLTWLAEGERAPMRRHACCALWRRLYQDHLTWNGFCATCMGGVVSHGRSRTVRRSIMRWLSRTVRLLLTSARRLHRPWRWLTHATHWLSRSHRQCSGVACWSGI